MKILSLLRISPAVLLLIAGGFVSSCSTDPSSYTGTYQRAALSPRNYVDSPSPSDRAFGEAAIGSGRSYP